MSLCSAAARPRLAAACGEPVRPAWACPARARAARQQRPAASRRDAEPAPGVSRHELLRGIVASGLLTALVPAGAVRAEGVFSELKNDTLAYSFKYPVADVDGNAIPVIFSRKPEKYSSAAPLTADARQRIVAELVDLKDSITYSMSVGPAYGALARKEQAAWTAKDVAEAVLADKSTARVTTGQRVSLATIESAEAVEEGGVTYWRYETVSQGSPSQINRSKETYRHAYHVTAARPGLANTPFLYTLSFSAPEDVWVRLEPLLLEARNSFKMEATGKGYVPPDKDPWLFF
ncbi:unnamed protein product [Pedinophyceae sp. YPF-701]|nr:unnamed protein product [Pedinophyceae sp. YPF-701]